MSSQLTDYKNQYIKKYRHYYSPYLGTLLKSKKTKAYSLAILSILTISFFGFFAIRPTVKTITELQRKIEDSKKVDEALQQKINSLISAQEGYQLVKNFVPAINEALPTEPDIARILQQIEQLTNDNGATFSAFEIGSVNYNPQNLTKNSEITPSIAGAKETSIEISTKISGNYSQLSTLLDRLLKSRRTINADSLEYTINTGQSPELKLILELNGYYLK